MRASQKLSRRTHCDLRIDIPASCVSEDPKAFSSLVSSVAVNHQLRTQLDLLLSISAPTVEPICANAAQQIMSVVVSGGGAGVDMLRAACALVVALQPPSGQHGDQPVPARVSVVRVLR